ncbi:hypothetical protein [Dialister sp.]|uniref:hypothetical protein n=1 Tax=Dialister sp. TaxID=1955814 RepID=UPI002E80B25D|nr:hypothetical protein [Dialister sp.]MEE3453456.1 hypothetical protein [Dialister sp.]
MIGVVGKVALLRQRKLFMGNEESGNGMRGAGRCAADAARVNMGMYAGGAYSGKLEILKNNFNKGPFNDTQIAIFSFCVSLNGFFIWK